MQASAQTDSAVSSLGTHRTWRTSETARLALSIAQQLQLESSRRLAAAPSAGSSITTSPKGQCSPESRPPAARPPRPRMGTRVPVSHVAAPAPRLLSHCIATQQLEPLSAAVPAPLPHAATERRPLRRSATANLWLPATAPSAPVVAGDVDVLQEFEPEFEADAQLDAQNAEAEPEWVLRRRPDGSHYVAKRAVRRSHTTFLLSKAQQRRDRLARRAAQVAAERSLLTTEEENASGVGADHCFVPHTARRTHLDSRRASRNRRDFLRRLQCGRCDDCKPVPQPFAQLSETFVALALL